MTTQTPERPHPAGGTNQREALGTAGGANQQVALGTAGGTDPWETVGWLMAVIWLVFLFFPILSVVEIVQEPWLRALDLGLIALFAVVYSWAFWSLPDDGPRLVRHGVVYLAILAPFVPALFLTIGVNSLSMVAYLVALTIYTMPRRIALVLVGLAIVVTVAVPLLSDTDGPWWIFVLIVLLVAVACFLPVELDARAARQREIDQQLVLAAERDRVARDVHDVLGHSLTVITVKSELAERLVDLDAERAREEMAQVRSIARQALAEIRATVAGLRVARLQDELEHAATALAGAGFEADLPADPDVVDPRHRIVLAWALREAVTNVVRHSGATRCTVRWEADRLTVTDDGRGHRGSRTGNGLRGLRERVEQVGGSVRLGPGPEGTGTTLEVQL